MATLLERLQHQALLDPTRVALRGPGVAISYSQMMSAAQALADQLRRRDVKRVGLCGDNSSAWVLADLACLLAGVVCVPVPVFFSTSQISHLLERTNLDALLFGKAEPDSEHLGEGVWVQPLRGGRTGERMPEETVKITFTSGSTGTPKGVCLSEAQVTCTTLALKERLAGVALQEHLCILPLATLLENIAGVYLPLLMGATVTLAPLESLGMTGSSGLNIERLCAGINLHKPQSMILVPELASALVAAVEQGHLDSRSFRFLAVGGGRVSPELLARGRSAGMPLYEGYGLSECGSVVALNVPGLECESTVGKPLSHVDVRVDADRRIMVRGNTHLGYLGGTPRAAQEWLDTGDLGAFSQEGFLSVNGRLKNLLITAFGRNISPEWLESELTQTLGAQQAVVFGDGDPNPSALVVVRDGCSPQQLRLALSALNSCLPDYARIETLYILRHSLTSSSGHLTTNGRPVRHRIQADLPSLMADAHVISMNVSVTRSTSSNPPGDSNMAFFDRLQQETANAKVHVTGAPVIGAIADGRFSLEAYTWFLTQAYHHVKHTVPLMMGCGARLPERMELVRKALVEYIDEEYGHQEWILNDLAACGVDKEAVRNGKPDLHIELMVAYLYDQINRGNPAAFFGMVQVLEGTSIELATPLGEQVQKRLGLPDEAFSYLYSHGALDQEHFEFFRNLMNGITDPDDQQAIIDAARVVYRLYGDMLHSIPLPASDKEPRHEAA